MRELDPNLESAVQAKKSPEMAASAIAPKPQHDAVDTSKRYDVYCSERDGQIVVYRNAFFKSRKHLLRRGEHDLFSDFLELEQPDGQTVFISGGSVIKFCEHGVTPSPETGAAPQE